MTSLRIHRNHFNDLVLISLFHPMTDSGRSIQRVRSSAGRCASRSHSSSTKYVILIHFYVNIRHTPPRRVVPTWGSDMGMRTLSMIGVIVIGRNLACVVCASGAVSSARHMLFCDLLGHVSFPVVHPCLIFLIRPSWMIAFRSTCLADTDMTFQLNRPNAR